MAIIKCPECGNNVSDRADNCVHCGYPLAKCNSSNLLSHKTEQSIATSPSHTNKQKGKFAKKRTGKKILKRCIIAIVSIIAFIILGFVALTIYWGVTDKPLDNDFDTKTERELDGLIYYVPGNWEYDDEQSNYYQHWFYRCDNFDNFAAAMMVRSFNDDGIYTEDDIISANADGKDKVVKNEIIVGTQQLSHVSYLNNQDGKGYLCDVYAAECDGCLFMVYFQCTEDFYNKEVIEEIVGAIEFDNYKNPNKSTDDTNETVSSSEAGIVENIYTAADIPDELMNENFKNIVDLFSKGFSESGLDISNATTYDDGETYIFYLDNLEFLGEECKEGYFQPRIIYSEDAINNNGTPNKIFFGYSNPLKSTGYKETVEKVEDIAKALDISDVGLIDNNYSSSSKIAIGDYATFTFPNLNLKLTVSNTDGSVDIEIVPIE